MQVKKIVPCIDIKDGKVVKGINFKGNREVGDPVEFAALYNAQGADELVFYDIAASIENRGVFAQLLADVKAVVTIPLTVAGGVNTVADFERVLRIGADKVSLNSGVLKRPELIAEAAKEFGGEKVVFAMDVKRVNGGYRVFARGGAGGGEDSGIDALDWAARGEQNGAGELVVNSIDTDGVKGGFDLELLEAMTKRVRIPIVASGGAGKPEHFLDVFKLDGVAAGLAASIFHYKEVSIPELKAYLAENGVKLHV
jgi:cyclase